MPPTDGDYNGAIPCREHNTYLHADEDEVGIFLSPHRESLNASWQVHRILRDGDTCVVLHGAAYSRYLAATDERASSGNAGKLVVLSVYDHREDITVVWKVIGAGNGDVLLRHISYGFLCANGRYLTTNTGITVDQP